MTRITHHTSAFFIGLIICSLTGIAFAQEDSDSTENGIGVSSETELSADPVEVNASGTARTSRPVTEQDRAETQATFNQERQEARAEFASTTEERRAEIQTTITERRVALQARAQERITNLAANMSNRMEAVIARLQNVTNRLEARIVKLNEAGVNTTASAAALASAQLSLDAALAEISTIDADVNATVSAADARASWAALKVKFTTIKNFIRTAHSELQSSVSLLKEAVVAQTQNTEPAVDAEVEAEATN